MEKEKKKYQYFTKAITCPDGTRKYIRGKTKKELEEKVKAAQAELDRGVNINDNTTFGELAQMWVDLCKRPHNRPQSMRAVLSRLNHQLMPILGPMKVRDIKPVHTIQVMSSVSHLAKQTQALVLSDLRAIFSFAMENQIIARSPVPPSLKPSGAPAKERVPLTPEECGRLLRAAEERKTTKWLYTFVLLCLCTGLRAAEACGLCWDCVDFEHNMILVRRQVIRLSGKYTLTDDLKTQTSKRDIPAPPELMAHLKSIKPDAKSITVLCGQRGPLRPGRCDSALRGLHFDVDVFPHLLRHTYATRLVEAGLDIKTVQYLLGHSTPSMTLKIYTHYDKRSRVDATAAQVAAISFTSEPVANVLQTADG